MAIQFCSPSYEMYRFAGSPEKYNTGSQAFDIPSDCTFLVVFVSSYHNDPNYLSNETGAMKCNSVNMNKGFITDGSTAAWMGQLFYLANPTTGTDVTIAWDFKTADDPMNYNVHIGAVYLKGVDTSSPIRGSGGENEVGYSYWTASTVTAQSGDLAVIAGWSYNDNAMTFSWTPSCTELTNAHDANYIQTALAHHSPTADTQYGLETGLQGDDGGISVLVLKPAADAYPNISITPLTCERAVQ